MRQFFQGAFDIFKDDVSQYGSPEKAIKPRLPAFLLEEYAYLYSSNITVVEVLIDSGKQRIYYGWYFKTLLRGGGAI